ncbi:predicted protein [Arabidopsis lyrata subsp. lyrata]|uniref:Predicted protein n=1 Tax=Arabidopsis lyrata subsp. lyrata TaxID=81972 RepID=D7M4L9_ARALL|nr:predicted protein [Arabidopsis lyrata subsp. lyrata]
MKYIDTSEFVRLLGTGSEDEDAGCQIDAHYGRFVADWWVGGREMVTEIRCFRRYFSVPRLCRVKLWTLHPPEFMKGCLLPVVSPGFDPFFWFHFVFRYHFFVTAGYV